MIDLNDLQRTLLTAAAATDDGCLVRPEGFTAAKWKAATAPLTKAGLLISIPKDGGVSDLMMTEAGRALVTEPEPTPTTAKPQRKKKAVLPKAPDPAGAAEPAAALAKGKIGILVGLMSREGGATIADMMTATGWQAHSVRGAISGSLKKALGLTVISDKADGDRVYRIVTEAA